jgi:Tlde1 domain
MAWTYESSTGRLFSPEMNLIGTGYSGGNGGKNPEGINNPELQYARNVGPIPEGNYTAGAPIDHSHLGPFAIPLEPSPNNVMHGRAGFYMHGDTMEMNHSASHGCIIMMRKVRHAFANSEDDQLRVVAVMP